MLQIASRTYSYILEDGCSLTKCWRILCQLGRSSYVKRWGHAGGFLRLWWDGHHRHTTWWCMTAIWGTWVSAKPRLTWCKWMAPHQWWSSAQPNSELTLRYRMRWSMAFLVLLDPNQMWLICSRRGLRHQGKLARLSTALGTFWVLQEPTWP